MAWSALDLVLDLAILCMPGFVIRSLHLDFRRKIVLMSIFGLGALYVYMLQCIGTAC